MACRREPHTVTPLLRCLNSLLYYPPAAVTGGTGEIAGAAFTHYLACCGEHQAGHYLGLGLGACLLVQGPASWSRGLSPLLPTYTLLLGPPYSAGVAGTSPALPGAAHYPPGSPPAPNADDLLFREAEGPRSCEPDSCLSCSLPQPSSFMEDLACAVHLSFCLPIAVSTSQCSLNVPSGFCVSREGHRTFWCYWLSSLEK